MPENQTAFYLVAALVALILGADKGGIGGMLGALGVPLMSLVVPVEQAVAIILPLLMVGDIFAVATHWRKWQGALILRLVPGGILGVLLGTYVLVNVPSGLLRSALGLLIFLFIAYRLLEPLVAGRLNYQPRGWHAILAGTTAGITSTTAHAGGPPISIYLLLQKLTPRPFVATAILFFAGLNLVKLPFYAAAGLFSLPHILSIIPLVPLVPVGVLLGKQLSVRVPRIAFEQLILLLLFLGAALMLFG